MPNLAQASRECFYGFLVGVGLKADQNPNVLRLDIKQFLGAKFEEVDVELLGPIKCYTEGEATDG